MAKEIEINIGSKKNRQSRKAQVTQHEIELSEKLGGIHQPASGATDGKKGDLLLEQFLLDSKETKNKEIRISCEDLVKISREAREINRKPGLVLKVGSAIDCTEWVLLRIDDFGELLRLQDDD